MKRAITALSVAFLCAGPTLAQTPHDAPSGHKMGPSGMQHEGMGDHEMGHQQMMGHGDGGFHPRFNDAAKWAEKFDNPERDDWQKPEQVLEALQLPANATVADIGAGTGYFTVRLAKAVPQGKVFAADVEKDMVDYLSERAKKEGLTNVIAVQAVPEGANLPAPVDAILVVDTYHHIGNRVDYFKKLQGSLKPSGKLVIVDFRMDSPDGPPKEHRIPLEKATAELKQAGYSLSETKDFLPRQYLAIYKKSTQ